MKRKPINNDLELTDVSETLIILPKHVLDSILRIEHAGDVIAVYTFYYYTAKWQRTNQIKATNIYCQTGLGMGEDRFMRSKKALIKLGLIEKIKITSQVNRGWYIKLNYISKRNTVESLILSEEHGNVGSCPALKNSENQDLGNPALNSLSSVNLNALSSVNKKLTKRKRLEPKVKLKHFEEFYKIYPRKIAKDMAKKAWTTLSNKKYDDRPFIKDVLTAVTDQTNNNWVETTIQHIPHASTWINGSRWDDDIEYVSRRNGNNKGVSHGTLANGKKSTINYRKTTKQI
jgi:hypothetical protein